MPDGADTLGVAARRALLEKVEEVSRGIPDFDGDERRLWIELDKAKEPAGGVWATAAVRHTGSENTSLAGRRRRHEGSLIVSVYSEIPGAGVTEISLADQIAAGVDAYRVADCFSEALSNQKLGLGPVVYTQVGTVRERGPHGKWSLARLDIPFHYDEVRNG